MIILKHTSAAVLIGGALVAGCAEPTAPKHDFLKICQGVTRADGSYMLSRTNVRANGLPVVEALDGGDARGATLIEACIEDQHKRMGTMPDPAGASGPVMKNGKMALPKGYIISPADKALWPTLTLAQQKRALSFLQSGSTIQSSLKED